MFARLARLIRAWLGYFISVGDDPEVMLQDAIEEMRTTMPKLNSVLVATRATVIRLEEERDCAAASGDAPSPASIQAALRDGSAAARSVAEETRSSCSSSVPDLNQHAGAAAPRRRRRTRAPSSPSKRSSRSSRRKIETSQRALKERQKAQVMRAPPTPSSSCSPTASPRPPTSSSSRSSRKSPSRRPLSKSRPGGIDTQSIERERTARQLKAAEHPAAVRSRDGPRARRRRVDDHDGSRRASAAASAREAGRAVTPSANDGRAPDEDVSAGSILREPIFNQYQAIVLGGVALASVLSALPAAAALLAGIGARAAAVSRFAADAAAGRAAAKLAIARAQAAEAGAQRGSSAR